MRPASLAFGLAAVLAFAAPASASTFSTLYQFCKKLPCNDGANVLQTPLVRDADGNFFGTAQNGGAKAGGVFFELIGGTKYKKLLDLPAIASPRGPLVMDVDGNFYGIEGTGNAGSGGIYKLTPGAKKKAKWKYQTLYTFCPDGGACADGGTPIELTYEGAASGVPYDGTSPLYGATVSGGTGGAGTVFQLSPKTKQWSETVIYSLCSAANCGDGMWPAYALFFDAKGSLYGVTSAGGTNGQGAVYKLTPNRKKTAWSDTTLYSFCMEANCIDGNSPTGLVADGQGNLYGGTSAGGDAGVGVLFKLAPHGKSYTFSRVYTFCQQSGCADGDEPMASPIVAASGILYGTTAGDSRLFSFDPAKSLYKVLHTLCTDATCSDGFEPQAPLTLDPTGNLFGTDAFGGSQHSGGAIFEYEP
jgi:uncharacterized repeat protein (TIGR03803 family)